MNEEMNAEISPTETEGKIAQEAAAKKPSKPQKPGTKVESKYALPASNPEILSKILKAYVIASKQGAEAVRYTDVAVVAGLHPTAVSRNNAFLSEGGFILPERWGYFKPSPETTEYAKQAPWDDESAKDHIRKIIDKTWFGETVQQRLQLQSTLSKSDLIRAFGIKATPDPSDANRLGLLLDLLLHFGYLVADEQGNYIARPKQGAREVSVSHGVDAFVSDEIPAVELPPVLPQSVEETRPGPITSQININLNLTAATTDEELELLVKKARTALNLLLDHGK
jgi:hypothetical protein